MTPIKSATYCGFFLALAMLAGCSDHPRQRVECSTLASGRVTFVSPPARYVDMRGEGGAIIGHGQGPAVVWTYRPAGGELCRSVDVPPQEVER